MKGLAFAACAGMLAAGYSAPAAAAEVFGGIYAHNVKTPLSLDGNTEDGTDLQIGLRGGAIAKVIGLSLQPYVFGALNTSGDTSYVAAGVSAKIGGPIYVRPGIGLAVHTGSAANFENPFNDKLELGSRVLFEPELAVGVQVLPKVTAEASWIHMSHGTLFGKQNPGIDNIGVRLNVAF